ncbi:J domain-containing protein [Halomonadaceae bacterium KBTZ08]
MHLILGLAVTVLLFLLLRQWARLDPAEKRKGLFWGVAVGVGALCTLLVVTGRVHVLGGLVAALVPFAHRGWRALQLWWLWRRIRNAGGGGGADQERDQESQGSAGNSGRMDPEEARAVLNVALDADRDEIVKAHKRLIQKVHPDRGGSDALAARVNEAKTVLLGGRKER